MGEIISLYGAPLFAFARRQTQGIRTPEDCEDFVNSFFLKCIEGDILQRADQAREKFRNFLAKSFKNHLLNIDRAEHTQKGAPAVGFVSLQTLTDDHGLALEPRSSETPEDAYHRVLRHALFDRLLAEFRTRCINVGQEKKYRLFLLREVNPQREGSPVPTYSALAAELKLPSENAANKIVLAAREDKMPHRCDAWIANAPRRCPTRFGRTRTIRRRRSRDSKTGAPRWHSRWRMRWIWRRESFRSRQRKTICSAAERESPRLGTVRRAGGGVSSRKGLAEVVWQLAEEYRSATLRYLLLDAGSPVEPGGAMTGTFGVARSTGNTACVTVSSTELRADYKEILLCSSG
jgi:hypothetical protein